MPFPMSGEGKDGPVEHGLIFAGEGNKLDSGVEKDQSWLNLAAHRVFDPVGRLLLSDSESALELGDYAAGFVKALPLFARGRVAFLTLIAASAADEMKVADSLRNQTLDAGLGCAKGLILKGTFKFFGRAGATPGMTGVGIGISSRLSDAALSRTNYFEKDDTLSLDHALKSTLLAGFHPGALAVDAITFGASDILWARIMNRSRGAAWYRPEITHSISGAAMGFTSEFGNQLQRQISTGSFDSGQLLRRSLIRSAFDGMAGGIGGHQSYRHMKLGDASADNRLSVKEARSTDFQRGIVVDREQLALRDGRFELEKKLPALTTETWVGWIHTTDGRRIRSVFRPDDGSESFAHRMQSEIAAYGLQTLGVKMAVPTTVARGVEIEGSIRSGYIQEMEGSSLFAFAKEKLTATNSKISAKGLQKLMADDKSLSDSYSNAWMHRLIMGEWDNHALNMTVNQKKGGSSQVRNIDLGDSLRPAVTVLDLTATPGVRQGYDKVNAHLYSSIAGKRFDGQTLDYLKGIQSRFSTAVGRQELHSVGITPQQADGLVGRINWLVKNESLPVGREALFYLALNDARRAFERWRGIPKASRLNDHTNFYK